MGNPDQGSPHLRDQMKTMSNRRVRYCAETMVSTRNARGGKCFNYDDQRYCQYWLRDVRLSDAEIILPCHAGWGLPFREVRPIPGCGSSLDVWLLTLSMTRRMLRWTSSLYSGFEKVLLRQWTRAGLQYFLNIKCWSFFVLLRNLNWHWVLQEIQMTLVENKQLVLIKSKFEFELRYTLQIFQMLCVNHDHRII